MLSSLQSCLDHFAKPERESGWQSGSEEGMGDTIQFSRYLPLLVDRGFAVIFRPQRPLAELMASSFPDVRIDVETPEEELSYDYWMPLLALPNYFFSGVNGIPGKGGYLRPKLRVGMVWQGFPGRYNDRNRSVRLELLARLAEVPGVELYSLQVGYGREQIEEVEAEIVDLGATFGSFIDTAAALKGMDLLVSVDTSVAHLGGALGVPTWVMIPYDPDWRWFLEGEGSPFYDSVTLFRQSEPGDWEGVVDRMLDRLDRRSGGD